MDFILRVSCKNKYLITKFRPVLTLLSLLSLYETHLSAFGQW